MASEISTSLSIFYDNGDYSNEYQLDFFYHEVGSHVDKF